ncbi:MULTISPECIES: hypothetical protein [unclassified Nocardia]|uniref:hypothetical protein n=1 Tax=unclassified Nocardia TaxID=2637762 RepID=UPI001CE3F07B|nr:MULTISPECIES: hypothetical protein [unclassified Nocardia]
MTEEWRGVVNAILYVVQFDELGPEEVSRVSRNLLTKPFFDLTPDQEYRALLEALESGAELNATIGTRHSEAEIRDFLNRIVAELDDMRPWPEPQFQELPMTRWPEFAGRAPFAQVDVSWPEIETKLRLIFNKSDSDGRECLPVRMRSGVEVGFIWPGWPGSSATAVVALKTDLPAHRIVDEIIQATLLEPSDITVLGPTSTVPRGSVARYQTTPIRPEFVGEEVPGNRVWRNTHVKYLNATERQAYKLTIRDGLLYDSTGRLLDTSTASTLWTPQGGRAIFVMDENGDLYSAPQHIAGVFHHSSFLAGAPAAGAGEIRVSNGHLDLISDHSTHYRPTRELTRQVVEHLRENGVHIDDSQVEYHAPPDAV